MKKIILSILTIAFLSLTIQAQHGKERFHKHHDGNHQKNELNLSDEQKQKMKTLNEDFSKNLMALKKQDDITVKEWKSKMENLKKKHQEDVKGIFTPEQKAKIEKMKMERKQMHEIDAKARMEKMKLHLNLTNEQVEKLSKDQKDLKEKIKSLKENQNLSDEKIREEMKALMQKNKESFNSVLTEDQKKKMQERKKHQKRRPVRIV